MNQWLLRQRPRHRIFQRLKHTLINVGGVSTKKHTSSGSNNNVPIGYYQTSKATCQNYVGHLRWMVQKDLLHQDMFLLGQPGPERRRLAMGFCELLNREVEYVAISRDTTESDLKQRREIVNGTAVFIDQPPVEAAIQGRILVLDGLEKAERNVLPTLNNLLENREMTLDDGRFLMKAETYDSLMKQGFELQENIIRVHPDFRVIALGLPVPPFPGRTLDPPLRSRFQARVIPTDSAGNQLEKLQQLGPDVPIELIQQLVGVSEAFKSLQDQSVVFPTEFALSHCVQVLQAFPCTRNNLYQLIQQSYPIESDLLENILTEYSVKPAPTVPLTSLSRTGPTTATAGIEFPCGETGTVGLVENQTFEAMRTEMIYDHAVGADLCLVGPKGCGKSNVARTFAETLGYSMELFTLFSDMTSRDLLQRRATSADANTTWVDSPLITAAKQGNLVIFDGIHRLRPDTLGFLQRFIQDRQVELLDGTQLLDASKYQDWMEKTNIFPIHPSFRILALAEPSSSRYPWLSSEALAMFRFHTLPQLQIQAIRSIITNECPNVPDHTVSKLLEIVDATRENQQELSLRQILRLAHRLAAYPETADQDLRGLIQDTLMIQFMPESRVKVLERILDSVLGKRSLQAVDGNIEPKIVVQGNKLWIDQVEAEIAVPQHPELVPQPTYFEIPGHTRILKQLLQDFKSGQKHMLLIGNQGVGKNKLADRLLQLLQYEREYVQLHRDTTVQTLTLVPSLIDGQIIWGDSPLIRAVKHGRTLLVDEADKAPLEVISVLKGLIEDGEMLLGDGRRLIDPTRVPIDDLNDDQVILVHPEFKMWVLANRPGYPFLGNNFFREYGDIFASHVIDNPDVDSELMLLQSYAPSVDRQVLEKLCAAFRELRTLVDQGVLAYPYSTREAVAVAKHLEKFPQDGVISVLENILAFDSFDDGLRKQLAQLFTKHGIPVLSENAKISVQLTPSMALPDLDKVQTVTTDPRPLKVEAFSGQKRRIWLEPPTASYYSPLSQRLDMFSEEKFRWQVPTKKPAVALAALPNDSLHALTISPLSIHSYGNVTSNTETKSYLFNELEHPYARKFEKSPQMIALPQRNELLLSLPSSDLLVFIDPLNYKSCRSLRLSTTREENKSHGWFESESLEQQHLLSLDQNLVVRYTTGASAFRIIDIETDMSYVVTCEDPIQSIGLISSNTLMLQHEETSSFVEWEIKNNRLNITQRQAFLAGATVPLNSQPLNVPAIPEHQVFALDHPNAHIQYTTDPNSENLQVYQSPSSDTTIRTDLSLNLAQSNQIAAVKESTIKIVTPERSLYREISAGEANPIVGMAELDNGETATLQKDGSLRLWQFDQTQTANELAIWKQMVGMNDEKSWKIEEEASSTPKTGLDEPKHGKEDPNNDPHVGGNTWAGGTGGSDTAGLGGRGGPYRLYKGHKVHQVSQAAKDQVTEEAKRKARAIAQRELDKRLEDIDMGKSEWKSYQRYLSRIQQETDQLRSILQHTTANAKERTWIKHQSSGELDDAKLIDGIAGEKLIFKKRGEDDSPLNNIQTLPKRILFVMDVSGSMYRFNGQDQRLERSLETAMMIMESFAGFEQKYDYSIVGHSGDSPSIPFVPFGQAPTDRKARLGVLQKMLAHSQFCMSGDHTVEAVDEAMHQIRSEPADDYFVVVVSDANLDRYRISPRVLGAKLIQDPQVKSHMIFIASFSDEAERILDQLPPGRGSVCLDTSKLPQLFKKMFQSHFQDQ